VLGRVRCFISLVYYKCLEYCLIRCRSSTYFWQWVHPWWAHEDQRGLCQKLHRSVRECVIKGLWQRRGQNSGSKCDGEVVVWALSKGRSNSSWAMGPQLLCPPTCHLLLEQNIGQSQPQAEGKGVWLMVPVEVSLQGHRTGQKGQRMGLERQSTQRQRNQHTWLRVCIKYSSFWPCTVLTHTPCQAEVYIAPPGDGVYIRK